MKNREAAILKAVKNLKDGEYHATAIKVEAEAHFNRTGGFYETWRCQDWMLERLEQYGLSRRVAQDDEDRVLTRANISCRWEVAGPLKYLRFYCDGSVDSECTFTISLENPENVFLIPKVMEVFKELGIANDLGINISRAGLHTALINDPDCNYPTHRAVSTKESSQFVNFRRSMMPLLPALFFLATPNQNSRQMGYRIPAVTSHDLRIGNGKYSAIAHRYTALEFRVFDTCYDNPEQVLDNLVVISKCMKYWSTTFKPSIELTEPLTFGNDRGSNLERFYYSEQHIEILNAGLRKLKPSYLTMGEVKRQRQFKLSRRGIKARQNQWSREARRAYREYCDRLKWSSTITREGAVARHLESLMQRTHDYSAKNRHEQLKAAREWAKSNRNLGPNPQPFPLFLANHLRNRQTAFQGEYSLNT